MSNKTKEKGPTVGDRLETVAEMSADMVNEAVEAVALSAPDAKKVGDAILTGGVDLASAVLEVVQGLGQDLGKVFRRRRKSA